MFFMLFIIRAGTQILADYPRLYWKRDSTPGTDWFCFQIPVPKGWVWTVQGRFRIDPRMAEYSGVRHSIGLARWWHLKASPGYLRRATPRHAK